MSRFFLWMRSLVDEELAQKVSPGNIEMVDKSYITRGGLEYVSDLMYKISIEPEHEAYFHILMELQPEKSMALRRLQTLRGLRALRILNYIVQFYEILPKKGKLPAVFPIVLVNGTQKPIYPK